MSADYYEDEFSRGDAYIKKHHDQHCLENKLIKRLTVKCVGCGNFNQVSASQDLPMCTLCGSPMIAYKAELK
ncbi:MAG: hypothetical protein PHE50_00090 [Dehalococcoidales bacterium]|nr:hypothetical protein [Dehalococcoidales bacterium]